jgi:hypothetical protein
MAQGKRVEISGAQRTEIWRRWKAGESLHEIGRAFGRKHTSIHLLLSHHGGIVPAVRRRPPQALTLAEREDVSQGIASGLSIRAISTDAQVPARRQHGNWRLDKRCGRLDTRLLRHNANSASRVPRMT